MTPNTNRGPFFRFRKSTSVARAIIPQPATKNGPVTFAPEGALHIDYVVNPNLISDIHHGYVVIKDDKALSWHKLYEELGEPEGLAHIGSNRIWKPLTKAAGYLLIGAGSTVNLLSMSEIESPWVKQEVGITVIIAGTLSLIYSLTLDTSIAESEMQSWLNEYNRQHDG